MTPENRINYQPNDTLTFEDLWASKIPEIKRLKEEELAHKRQKEELDKKTEMKEVASTLGISVERGLPFGPTFIFEKNGEEYVSFNRKPPRHKTNVQK